MFVIATGAEKIVNGDKVRSTCEEDSSCIRRRIRECRSKSCFSPKTGMERIVC
jgi:regulator of extracellular matrix RemA (YlzA/DUF370 family)